MSLNDIERSVMQKIATQFTKAEAGYLARLLSQVKTASATNEKLAAAQTAEFQPEIFKEALALDPAVLATVIQKVASQMDPELADLVVGRARSEVESHQAQQAEVQKLGFELGRAQYHGFQYEAAQQAKTAADQQTGTQLANLAPNLAVALGVR